MNLSELQGLWQRSMIAWPDGTRESFPGGSAVGRLVHPAVGGAQVDVLRVRRIISKGAGVTAFGAYGEPPDGCGLSEAGGEKTGNGATKEKATEQTLFHRVFRIGFHKYDIGLPDVGPVTNEIPFCFRK